MVRAVVPAMKKQGRGGIVNISSIAGIMGGGSSVAYAASKGAVNTMTLSSARALAPEIRVNAVCPGFAETRWLKEGLGEQVYAQVKVLYENCPPASSDFSCRRGPGRGLVFGGGRPVTGEFLMVDSGFHLGTAPMKAR